MSTRVFKLGYRTVQIEVILNRREAGGAVRAGGAPRPHWARDVTGSRRPAPAPHRPLAPAPCTPHPALARAPHCSAHP